jgi:hypothetical protein
MGGGLGAKSLYKQIFMKFFLSLIFTFVILISKGSCQNVLDTVYVTDERILSFEEEWRLKAIRDMENGNYYLLTFGMVKLIANPWDITELTRKYGFTYKYEGFVEGGFFYNDEVRKHLDSLNGKGWYDNFLNEYKALEDSAFKKLK